MKSDLKDFQSGITRAMIDEVTKYGIEYKIFGNKIYRQKDCNFPARCSGVEYFIKKAMKVTKLPNMDIIINVRDYPQINQHFGSAGPVLSFSKTNEYKDILYPAWSFWGKYLKIIIIITIFFFY
jgi:EGF-domain serine glucosyl/xylosyltransferase